MGHSADMQAQPELDGWLASAPSPVVDHCNRGKRIYGRIQRRLADCDLFVRCGDLEHDQDRVADELQDLAATRRRRSGAVLKIFV